MRLMQLVKNFDIGTIVSVGINYPSAQNTRNTPHRRNLKSEDADSLRFPFAMGKNVERSKVRAACPCALYSALDLSDRIADAVFCSNDPAPSATPENPRIRFAPHVVEL